MNNRFAKLMSTMGQPQEQNSLANPKIDDETAKRLDKEHKLSLIDDKISQLEQSEDPNSLESLNFWKQQRALIAGN